MSKKPEKRPEKKKKHHILQRFDVGRAATPGTSHGLYVKINDYY